MNWNVKKAVAAALIALVTLGSVASFAAANGEENKPSQTKAAAKTPAKKVQLNAATAEELEALPKIGPKTAQRIVEYRDSHKGFKTVDELLNVKGIGPKVLELIRPHITL